MSDYHDFFSAEDARVRQEQSLRASCRPVVIEITETIRKLVEDGSKETSIRQSLAGLDKFERDWCVDALETLGYRVDDSHPDYLPNNQILVSW